MGHISLCVIPRILTLVSSQAEVQNIFSQLSYDQELGFHRQTFTCIKNGHSNQAASLSWPACLCGVTRVTAFGRTSGCRLKAIDSLVKALQLQELLDHKANLEILALLLYHLWI